MARRRPGGVSLSVDAPETGAVLPRVSRQRVPHGPLAFADSTKPGRGRFRVSRREDERRRIVVRRFGVHLQQRPHVQPLTGGICGAHGDETGRRRVLRHKRLAQSQPAVSARDAETRSREGIRRESGTSAGRRAAVQRSHHARHASVVRVSYEARVSVPLRARDVRVRAGVHDVQAGLAGGHDERFNRSAGGGVGSAVPPEVRSPVARGGRARRRDVARGVQEGARR